MNTKRITALALSCMMLINIVFTSGLFTVLAVSPTNLATGATATTDSNEAGTSFTPNKMLDGVVNRDATSNQSRWSSSGDGTESSKTAHWIKIDLGTQKAVRSLKIDWEKTNILGYTIKYSNDDTNWELAYTQTDLVENVSQNVNFDRQITARYFKIDIPVDGFRGNAIGSASNWYCVSIFEIAMYANEIANPYKIACMGDSITFGYGGTKSYPIWLQETLNAKAAAGETTLADSFTVTNYGVSGATMRDDSNMPYRTDPRTFVKYRQALESKSDAFIVMLGTNDSKRGANNNWISSPDGTPAETVFEQYAISMINDIKGRNPAAVIYFATPLKCVANSGTIVADNINNIIAPLSKEIALRNGCKLIDVHKATKDWTTTQIGDNIHPNNAGYELLGKLIADAVASDTVTNTYAANAVADRIDTLTLAASITGNTGFDNYKRAFDLYNLLTATQKALIPADKVTKLNDLTAKYTTTQSVPQRGYYSKVEPFNFPSAVNETKIVEAEHFTLLKNSTVTVVGSEQSLTPSNGKMVKNLNKNDKMTLFYNASKVGEYKLILSYAFGNEREKRLVMGGENTTNFSLTVLRDNYTMRTKEINFDVRKAGAGTFNITTDWQDESAACYLDKFDIQLVKEGVTDTIKVVCVGDSITYGDDGDWDKSSNPNKQNGDLVANPYPKLLEQKLNATPPDGKKYEVLNAGVNGAHLMEQKGNSYITAGPQFIYQSALEYKPDIVVLMLGTNDAIANFTASNDYTPEYLAEHAIKRMIDEFRVKNSATEFYLVTPIKGTGSFAGNANFPTIMETKTAPAIRKIAVKLGVKLIDLNKETATWEKAAYVPDGVHPNQAGYTKMADWVYAAMKDDAITTAYAAGITPAPTDVVYTETNRVVLSNSTTVPVKVEAEALPVIESGNVMNNARVTSFTGASGGKELSWCIDGGIKLYYNAPKAGIYTVKAKYRSGSANASMKFKGDNIQTMTTTFNNTSGVLSEKSFEIVIKKSGEGYINITSGTTAQGKVPPVDYFEFTYKTEKRPYKIAAVGDSITDRGYSEILQTQLNAALANGTITDPNISTFDIVRCSKYGSTTMSVTDKPYRTYNLEAAANNSKPEYEKALDLGADGIIIMLGTNDAKPQNWFNMSHSGTDPLAAPSVVYKKEAQEIADSLLEFNPNAKVFYATSMHVRVYEPTDYGYISPTKIEPTYIHTATLNDVIAPLQREIAAANHYSLIDVNDQTKNWGKDKYSAGDTVHPADSNPLATIFSTEMIRIFNNAPPVVVVNKPIITTNLPATLTLPTVGAATLTVAATGDGTLSYKLYKDDVLKETKATGSFSITESGNYKVIVVNTVAAGTAEETSIVCNVTNASVAKDVNLAIGKTATSSTDEAASVNAPKAIDGNSGTRWACSVGNKPAWLKVDLGSAMTVGSVSITFRRKNASAFTIDTSTDGTTWTAQKTHTSYITNNILDENFTAPVSARYVRVHITGYSESQDSGPDGGNWNAVSINEFKIYSGNVPKILNVACVGDSITYGYDRPNESYPVKLGPLLTTAFDNGTKIGGVPVAGYDAVASHNFGKNSATMKSHATETGDGLSYERLSEYTNSKALKPDVVIMMLGTNDSKATQWENFVIDGTAIGDSGAAADYYESANRMIRAYRAANPNVKLYIASSPKAFDGSLWGISDTRIKAKIIPLQERLAKENLCGYIDMHKFTTDNLVVADMLSDKVHPSSSGYIKMAGYVRDELVVEPKLLYNPVQGDANLDSKVSLEDALSALKVATTIKPADTYAQSVTIDYDKNGTLDILDIVSILKGALNLLV